MVFRGHSLDAFAGAHFTALAGAVFLLGVFLRARRLKLKGLFLWDEAAYYRETLALREILGFYRLRWRELLRARLRGDEAARKTLVDEFKQNHDHLQYVWYKVLHSALTYVSCGLIKQADFAMCVPAFILGCCGILLAVWTGREVGGPAAGIFAGLCLAVSGMHTLHSRSAEPETGSATSLQVATIFLLLHKSHFAGADTLFSAGSLALLAGCGFFLCCIMMFNPVWFAIVFPLGVVMECAYLLRGGGGGFSLAVMSFGIVAASILLSTLLINIPFFINEWLLPENGVRNTMHRYAEWAGSLVSILGIKKATALEGQQAGDAKKGEFCGVRLTAWHRYSFLVTLLLYTEGPAFAAGAAGAAMMISWGGPGGAMVAATVIFLFAMITLSPFKSSRASLILTPALAVCAGVFISSLPAAAAVAVTAAVAVYGTARGLQIGSLTSGIKKAAEFIRSRGGADFFCSSGPFSLVYGADRTIYTLPDCYETIYKKRTNRNIQYAVVEHHEYFPSIYVDDTMRLISANCEPVFAVEDPCVTYYPLLAEAEFLNSGWSVLGSESAFGLREEIAEWNRFRMSPSESDRTVRVYNLDQVFGSEKMNKLFFGRQLMLVKDLIARNVNHKLCYTLLRELNETEPENTEVLYLAAGFFMKAEQYETAGQFFRVVAAKEEATEVERKWSRMNAFICAERSGQEGASDSAEAREIELLIDDDIFPDEFKESTKLQLFSFRVSRLCVEREYAETLLASEKRLAANPNCVTARFYRAIGMAGTGRREEAAAELGAMLDEGSLPQEYVETARALTGRRAES